MNYETELVTGNLCYLQNVHRDCLVKTAPASALRENMVDCVCNTAKTVTTPVIQLLDVMVTAV